MSKDLTLSRARYLAEQSHAIKSAGSGNLRPRSYGALDDIPWHVKNLASLIVGAIGLVLALLVMLVLAVINGDSPANNTSDVNALVGVVEKMVDANLEREREERARAQEKEELEEKEDQSLIVEIMFWVLLAALFLGFASQYSGLWGVGIALFIMVLLFGLIYVPGVLEVAKIAMARS